MDVSIQPIHGHLRLSWMKRNAAYASLAAPEASGVLKRAPHIKPSNSAVCVASIQHSVTALNCRRARREDVSIAPFRRHHSMALRAGIVKSDFLMGCEREGVSGNWLRTEYI